MTPLQNAEIKAQAYFDALHMPVFSCDSGLYFDEVPEDRQPGVFVRRAADGHEMDDEEMMAHYAALAHEFGGPLTARYRNAICFILDKDHRYMSMDESLAGEPYILWDQPHPKRVQGFPLDRLSKDRTTGKYYYDMRSAHTPRKYTERVLDAFSSRQSGLGRPEINFEFSKVFSKKGLTSKKNLL